MKSNFYVYEHWRPDTDVCFYVGKGSGKRAYRFKRGRHYNHIIMKLSTLGMCAEVRLVADGLSEVDAFDIEIERIAFWRASGVELTNRTDGGDGVRGDAHSAVMRAAHARPDTKIKHREAIKAAHARPATKAAHRAACKRGQGSPEARERTRQRMIAIRSNPIIETKRRAALVRTLAKPEVRQKKRLAMIKAWSRPDVEQKIRSGIRAALATPEVSAKLSATTLGRRWINDGTNNRRLKRGLPLPSGWTYGVLERA